MTPPAKLQSIDKPMDSHDLAELEKNIETRVRVGTLIEKVDDLSASLKSHMEKEEKERRIIDKKLLYLFLLATGNLVVSGGGDMMSFLIKLFM